MPDVPITFASLCEKIASDINAFLRKRGVKRGIDAAWVRKSIAESAGTKQEKYTRDSHVQAGAKAGDLDAAFKLYKEENHA